MIYVIAEPCIGVKDTACVDACPVDCIHPRRDETGFAAAPQLYIDPDNCIGCSMCVPVCPVAAIYADDELPPDWRHFAQVNADLFRIQNADEVSLVGQPAPGSASIEKPE